MSSGKDSRDDFDVTGIIYLIVFLYLLFDGGPDIFDFIYLFVGKACGAL